MYLLLLFYRLMVRPLFREPVRTLLTILAIALGVAVVLAIDLAGDAATGSFRSSMETLAGDNDLEVTASGGVLEDIVGTLATLSYTIRVSPRVEDYAVIVATKKSLPLIGLDLVADGSIYAQSDGGNTGATSIQSTSDNVFEHLGDADSIWVGSSGGYKTGDHVELLINDQVRDYIVRGVYPDSNGNESAVVMDIAAAQRALNRFGRVDRILLKVPQTPSLEEWQQRLRTVLPAAVEVRPQGSGTNENRRMLAAFRWNLRLLSYISLVVGAFLIYNTISVSVVRRRPEIGIVRALLVIEGKLKLGEMLLSGVDHAANGESLVRGTWKPADGGVRETAVTSTDGGKTWNPWFDLLFRPHTELAKSNAAVAGNARNIPIHDGQKIVAELDTQYQAAVKKNDAATMDRLLADDFVLVTGFGKAYTKADLVNDARGGHVVYEH